MKRFAKRSIAMLLAVIMLVSILSISTVAEGSKELGQYDYYTVLGDSNASGYGLDAYFANAGSTESVKDDDRIPGSYVDILSDAVGATTVNVRSHCAWRCNELLYMLNPDCGVNTSSTYLYALGFIDRSVMDGEADRIKEAIINADLISVDFGSNDIYTQAINQTNEVINITDIFGDAIEDIKTGVSEAKSFEDLVNAVTASTEKAAMLVDWVKEFKANLDRNTETFKTNIVMVIDEIRKLNKDAKIILLGVFCPVSFDLDLGDTMTLDIPTSSDKRINSINNYLKNECPVKDEYTFVDVSKATCYGLPALDFGKLIAMDENVKYSAVKMVHPDEAGHQYIGQQIIDTMSNTTVSPKVSADLVSFLKKLLSRTYLKWDKMTGVSYYRIYRCSSVDGDYYPIGISLNTTFVDFLALGNRTYYYKVLPIMGIVNSVDVGYSTPVTVKK